MTVVAVVAEFTCSTLGEVAKTICRRVCWQSLLRARARVSTRNLFVFGRYYYCPIRDARAWPRNFRSISWLRVPCLDTTQATLVLRRSGISPTLDLKKKLVSFLRPPLSAAIIELPYSLISRRKPSVTRSSSHFLMFSYLTYCAPERP